MIAFFAVTVTPALLSLGCWFARHHASGPARLPLAGS